MSTRDIDFGMIWQGYNPSIITHQQAPEPFNFYFGGSQVPTAHLVMEGGRLNLPNAVPMPTPHRVRRTMTGIIKKLPSVRK